MGTRAAITLEPGTVLTSSMTSGHEAEQLGPDERLVQVPVDVGAELAHPGTRVDVIGQAPEGWTPQTQDESSDGAAAKESDAQSKGARRSGHSEKHPNNGVLFHSQHALVITRPEITRISEVFSKQFSRNVDRTIRNTQHGALFRSPSRHDSTGRRRKSLDRKQESNTYHTDYSCG